MARLDKWLSEEPRRPPAEIACLLARDRFWKDEEQRLIATHRDWPDVTFLLDLDEAFAHAFVLALSRLPSAARRGFADAFYARRLGGGHSSPDDSERLRGAAAIVLRLAEFADMPELRDERVLDLLRGAAQGDDLTRTPAPAVSELQATIARIRSEFRDPADPRGASSLALAEVLDPSSGVVDLKEVLARSVWAAAETLETPDLLRFVLEVERLL